MKSKLEINYLPEDKQYSTEKRKREFKSLFIFIVYFLYVLWRLLVITLLSIEWAIWCTWTWIIHEVVPPPTSFNNRTTFAVLRSLLEYHKKAEQHYIPLCSIDQIITRCGPVKYEKMRLKLCLVKSSIRMINEEEKIKAYRHWNVIWILENWEDALLLETDVSNYGLNFI